MENYYFGNVTSFHQVHEVYLKRNGSLPITNILNNKTVTIDNLLATGNN